MESYRLFAVFFVAILIESSSACDGYNIKLKSINNCGDENQVIKVSENATTIVNDKCEVFSYTCADVKKYTQALAVVTISRGMMVIFNGTENMCTKKKKTNELSLVMMSVCGLRCSMDEGAFCDGGRKVVTFSASKKLLALVGGDSLKTRVVVKHDTGSSCFQSELSIARR